MVMSVHLGYTSLQLNDWFRYEHVDCTPNEHGDTIKLHLLKSASLFGRQLEASDFFHILNSLKNSKFRYGIFIPGVFKEICARRACKGSVMFGDALSKQKCESLIGELASCLHAYQCAHSRPTLAPIVNFEFPILS